MSSATALHRLRLNTSSLIVFIRMMFISIVNDVFTILCPELPHSAVCWPGTAGAVTPDRGRR
jgi:hypothetical protein